MAEIYKTFMAEAEKLDPEGFAKAKAERAELEALREDAERYRWLRDVASGGDWEHIGWTTDPVSTDAKVDEYMAAYKAVGDA